ncbi:MAG TPA: hypothetical protein VN260_05615 [Dissulfurispiraceae bacterium]|nr:hypothetical protein [Dissulfurispiraceae bacterium]
MRIQFGKMVEVRFSHRFFDGAGGEVFDLQPTRECRKHLANYGLLFKKIQDGFVLLYETTNGGGGALHPLKPIDSSLTFSFVVLPMSPHIVNYSDMPMDGLPGFIYRLHNLQNNQQQGELLLTADIQKPYLSAADRIALNPLSFRYTFQSLQPSVLLEVLDSLGATVQSHFVNTTDGAGICAIDLRSRGPGMYTIRLDGQETLEFYGNDEMAPLNALSVIDIFCGSRVPAPYRFLNDAFDVVKKTYTVRVDARRTFWKYYVVLKYRRTVDPGDLSIHHPGPGIQFTRLPVLTLGDGSTAVPFVSNQSLPLALRPVKGISLKKKNGGGGGPLEIQDLANPSAATLVPGSGGTEAYSEMYIYI